MACIPAGLLSTAFSVRQGRQLSISDEPNSTTTGRPKAAAMWAGPLSFPTKIAAPASLRVLIEGSGGHAGGVLMPERRDALCAAAEMILAVESADASTRDQIVRYVGNASEQLRGMLHGDARGETVLGHQRGCRTFCDQRAALADEFRELG